MDIGIYGMGRMGFNMARRLLDKSDHRVIAGNRSPGKVDEAVEHGAEGAYSVEEFVQKQQSPRVLWSMLPAGDVTDQMIDEFIELAERAFEKDAKLDSIRGYVEDSGEGRWTVQEAIEEDVPANVIAGSLFARFASRQDDSFAMKVLAALRGQFGGHAIQEASTEYPEGRQQH